jgi:hypothetical protein
MTITHGTRSAFNRGCRCDACREASRLARARQRAAEAQRPAHIGPRGGPWAIVVATAALGAMSLWHAKKLKTDDDALGKSVWPWVVAGVVLLGIAAGITVSAIRATEDGSRKMIPRKRSTLRYRRRSPTRPL